MLILTPTFAGLIVSVPFCGENATLRQKGIMMTGFKTVTDFAKMNAVAVDAQDLFPVGTVKIYSIQTFGDYQIDDVLLQAAGVAISSGGSLADVFEQVIEGHYSMLPAVESLMYVDAQGVVAQIGEREILVGNRDLLRSYKVDRPDAEIERQIRLDGKFPIYLGMAGELCAMFVVNYEVNDNVEESVHNVVRAGNTLLVRTVDPNIDQALVCSKFKLPSESVCIMENVGAEVFSAATTLGDRTGGIVSRGSAISTFGIACMCERILSNIKISTIIQVVCCFLSFTIFAIISFATNTYTINVISLKVLIVFQLVTGVLTLITSVVRKPRY